MDLPPSGLSVGDYEALPEDVCRRIEIVDGAIIATVAPRRLHQNVGRRLANVLEEACGPGFAVSTDVDLRLRDVPLLNRRPDAVVYDASLPDSPDTWRGSPVLAARGPSSYGAR
jgi:Uma2 family endonuclease